MPLADLKVLRRIRAAAQGRDFTSQERKTLARIKPPRTYPRPKPSLRPYDGSIALLPLAQLYTRDIPDLRTPAGTDLLQVLWCPFDHPPKSYMPKTVLFWRSAAEVTDILTGPPEPPAVQYQGYLPEPCLLLPEQITEYPHPSELSPDILSMLDDWGSWQAAGDVVDSRYASYPAQFYGINLSVAPGWQVGGLPSWGLTDPIPQSCLTCDTEMPPLLTIPSHEWGSSDRSWIPYELQEPVIPTRGGEPRPEQPAAIQIGRGYKQQLYICPASPEHPHTELMQ
ncbi:non-ribosomal peptide synthetase [Streptomyces sp. NPDC050400]|uniref:non-ribosomal peptide synthetase n=1 Tax=Streptomyces sp. NPDC050400 TaxID=3365610 RepID=UPI003797B0F5